MQHHKAQSNNLSQLICDQKKAAVKGSKQQLPFKVHKFRIKTFPAFIVLEGGIR